MISVIVPCFNEEENIRTYNERLFPIINSVSELIGESFEYVFVDDGSSDSTLNELHKLSKSTVNTYPIVIVPHGKNKGLGSAVNTGIHNATGDLVVLLDSDLTFRPEDIPKLYNKMEESVDCVSGSPFATGGLMDDVPFIRILPSKCVNLMYRTLLRTNLTSFSGIFKLYKREVFSKFEIESTNFDVNAEIISKMLIQKMVVVEVPVKLYTREFGESKINVKKEIINNLRLLTKIIKVKYLKKSWS